MTNGGSAGFSGTASSSLQSGGWVLFWLVRAFFVQLDAPTSQSYSMAVVGPEERSAMAAATSVSRSAGIAAGLVAATALWGAASASTPFEVGGVVKIAYDLTLWCLFRRVKPPEEASEPS